jgi:hypothetical protein
MTRSPSKETPGSWRGRAPVAMMIRFCRQVGFAAIVELHMQAVGAGELACAVIHVYVVLFHEELHAFDQPAGDLTAALEGGVVIEL